MPNLLAFSRVMIATACAMLGLTQSFLWWHSRRKLICPPTMVMAFSAMAVSILEMSPSRAFASPPTVACAIVCLSIESG